MPDVRDEFYTMKAVLGLDANCVEIHNDTKLYILKLLAKKKKRKEKK